MLTENLNELTGPSIGHLWAPFRVVLRAEKFDDKLRNAWYAFEF